MVIPLLCLLTYTTRTLTADTCARLVMYYPVSALVTLFANILQNPQDPRARVDLTQMHIVVQFLRSVLDLDEMDDHALTFEDGSVKRMLVVCGEFERIAKIVLDKAEKDGLGKKKRKADDHHHRNPRPEPRRPEPVDKPATSQTQTTVPDGAANVHGLQMDMNSQVRCPSGSVEAGDVITDTWSVR